MDYERAIETQRLKLLRIVAGLDVLVGFLSLGPVSRGFSISVCGFVGAMLSRAETAARYLVIAQARSMEFRGGMITDRNRFSDSLAHGFFADEADVSLSDCRQRLQALCAVLTNLPCHAARLIRRIEKQMRGVTHACQLSYRFDTRQCPVLHDWRLARTRIERPPDKGLARIVVIHGPLPDCRAGGEGACRARLKRSFEILNQPPKKKGCARHPSAAFSIDRATVL